MHRSPLGKAALAAVLLAAAAPAGLALAQGQQPEQQLSAPELSILLGAVYGNTKEIELSQIGQQSRNEQVRAYAQRMIREHEQANEELRQIAQANGVKLPPPPSDGTQQQVYERLRQAEGHEFDEHFMQLQYEGHRIALAAHASAPEVTENERLDQYARTFGPKIVTHLQDAQNILQIIERAGS